MKNVFQHTGRHAVLIGYLTALAAATALAAVLSTFVINGVLPEKSIPIGVYVILFISGLIGSVIAGREGDSRIAIRVFITGICLLLSFLSAGILLFDGKLGHLLINGLCILISCSVACALCIRNKKSKPKRKKAIW